MLFLTLMWLCKLDLQTAFMSKKPEVLGSEVTGVKIRRLVRRESEVELTARVAPVPNPLCAHGWEHGARAPAPLCWPYPTRPPLAPPGSGHPLLVIFL